MNLDKYKSVIKKIDSEIEKLLKGEPEILYEASRHLTLAGGKRLRPLLCLLSCECVHGNKNNALKSAIAIELIHTFTLIHDDIMDEDDLRRGVPSVHKAYGNATAILAGDLLFAKAFEISDAKVKDILAKATEEICEGQQIDMSFEQMGEVSEREYLEMIRKKTAVLFEASCRSGAVLGNGSKSEINSLTNYGKNLGMAFQIYDDVLDIIGKEEEIGKPVGSDISQGKKSIVVIKGLELFSQNEKNKFNEIVKKGKSSEKDIEYAIKLLNESNAIKYCKNMALSYSNDAKKSLEKFSDSEAKKSLIEIADFIIQRMY